MSKPIATERAEYDEYYDTECVSWSYGYIQDYEKVQISGEFRADDLDEDWRIAEDSSWTVYYCEACDDEYNDDDNLYQITTGETIYLCGNCDQRFPTQELAEECCE